MKRLSEYSIFFPVVSFTNKFPTKQISIVRLRNATDSIVRAMSSSSSSHDCARALLCLPPPLCAPEHATSPNEDATTFHWCFQVIIFPLYPLPRKIRSSSVPSQASSRYNNHHHLEMNFKRLSSSASVKMSGMRMGRDGRVAGRLELCAESEAFFCANIALHSHADDDF